MLKKFNGSYVSDHWVYDTLTLSQMLKWPFCLFVCSVREHNQHVAVYLNPTDQRGYRTIVRPIYSEVIEAQETFNRLPTASEALAVDEVVVAMMLGFAAQGLFL